MFSAIILLLGAYAQSDTVFQNRADPRKLQPDDSVGSYSGDHLHAVYVPHRRFGYVTNLPEDLWLMAKSPFRRQNVPVLSIVAGSSAILIWQDQHLINAAMQLGKNIHLDPSTEFKIAFKVKDTKIIKIPRNLNTVLYQMGEGGTSMIIAGGLYIYGKIGHSNRSLQVASDLTETFFSMGIATQLLKRSFGRQSPFAETRPGGTWHPFPAFRDYQHNTSNYDGFPSGHLATMMATVTVLAENYPEKRWIWPVGYSIMAMTSFAMMNTEVHWAGDYPLALALGYVAGRVTVHRHKKKEQRLLPSD